MSFQLDPRLDAESVLLQRTEHGLILLRDEARWPWCVVVPQTAEAEFHALDADFAQRLMSEVRRVAAVVAAQPGVSKLNLASFGNVVAQQHWHIIGRWPGDPAWPGSVIGLPRQAMTGAALAERARQISAALPSASPPG